MPILLAMEPPTHADFRYDPGGFVAVDDRQFAAPRPAVGVQVGTTDPNATDG